MLGEKIGAGELATLKAKRERAESRYAVKSVVFPFLKLIGTDIALGPEMRSTGETMGIGRSFETTYYKALLAAGIRIRPGAAFLSGQRVGVQRLLP